MIHPKYGIGLFVHNLLAISRNTIPPTQKRAKKYKLTWLKDGELEYLVSRSNDGLYCPVHTKGSLESQNEKRHGLHLYSDKQKVHPTEMHAVIVWWLHKGKHEKLFSDEFGRT